MPNSLNHLKGIIIALVATILSAAIFWGFNNQSDLSSLEVQAKNSASLAVALANQKPTLTEFYANWCSSCQAMAKDLAAVKKEYADSVNFVMINIDNDKWLPEVLRYRVDGIPHFVFFDKDGKTIGQTIGEQPLTILQSNLAALVANSPLPYVNISGQASPVKSDRIVKSSSSADPRSHGG